MNNNHEPFYQIHRALAYATTQLWKSTHLSAAVDLLALLERLSNCEL